MEAALDAGADYVGMVREPTSPRYVENPVRLAESAAGRAAAIGVYGEFYDDAYIQVFDSIQTLSDVVIPGLLRVFRLGESPVDNIVKNASGPVLLDAFDPRAHGGTGMVADWGEAAEVVRRCSHPVFLAGGLTPDNVSDAIRLVRPYGVDVSSGVEESKGKKDHHKLRAFIQAVRNV
jgi:phosphoribosylanthranilate isomerase